MRSLFFEYPRTGSKGNILIDLFNPQQVKMKVNIPIKAVTSKGIELKLPTFLTGVFYLKVQDGDLSFLKKIAVQ